MAEEKAISGKKEFVVKTGLNEEMLKRAILESKGIIEGDMSTLFQLGMVSEAEWKARTLNVALSTGPLIISNHQALHNASSVGYLNDMPQPLISPAPENTPSVKMVGEIKKTPYKKVGNATDKYYETVILDIPITKYGIVIHNNSGEPFLHILFFEEELVSYTLSTRQAIEDTFRGMLDSCNTLGGDAKPQAFELDIELGNHKITYAGGALKEWMGDVHRVLLVMENWETLKGIPEQTVFATMRRPYGMQVILDRLTKERRLSVTGDCSDLRGDTLALFQNDLARVQVALD
jgi:hypothetical protein